MMGTATLLKDNLKHSMGHAALYKLEPPLKHTKYDYSGETETESIVDIPLVRVSAVHLHFGGIETYIFAANESGDVTDWGELEGSRKGTLSHAVVLDNIGYTIVSEAQP
jgi:hypothetical protein